MSSEKRQSPDAPSDVQASALDLFCQKCGYNLRGNESERCPECGAAVDLDALSQPQIPWAYRKSRGSFRSYWQTVWLVMFRRRRLHEEMSRNVSEDHARGFRRVTLLYVVLPLALVSNGVYFAGVITGGLLFDLTIVLSVFSGSVGALACVWLFLWAISSITGDFFRDKSASVELQNRAVALSYYTCAPMVWIPLAALINVVIWILGKGLMLGSTIEAAAIIMAALLPVLLFGMWAHSLLALARRVLQLSLWEQIRFEAVQVILWLGTAVATLVILPLGIVYVIVIIFSFL